MGTPVLSEIEGFQHKLHSARWAVYVFAALAAASLVAAPRLEDWLCALLIGSAAFHSVYLWAERKVLGMPIMPVFALLCLLYYATPFVAGHPVLEDYSAGEKLFAAATVAAVLVVMTFVWAGLASAAPPRARAIRTLAEHRGAIPVLIACMIGAIFFQSSLLFYFFSPSSEVFGVLRAILLTLGLLAIFALAYLHGAGSLAGAAKYLFFALAIGLITLHSLSLYLISAAQYALIALLGYFLGSGRAPWKLAALIVAAMVVLQAGKPDMRVKQLEEGDSGAALSLIAEWYGTGLRNLLSPSLDPEDKVPLIQRVSLVQLLLRTQTEAPEDVPYLYGATYVPIPALLVPRVIWPDRPNTSETLVQLNEHYGLLTRESAEETSIGWGIIAEAYANFGLAGCLMVGLVLGAFLGLAQRLCGRYPVLSARGMLGLLTVYALLGMELSMAQFLAVLAQSSVAVILLAVTVMQPRRAVV